MSCNHMQPGQISPCAVCQMQSLQDQNNQAIQSYQLQDQNNQAIQSYQLQGVTPYNYTWTANSTNINSSLYSYPLKQTLDEAVDETYISIIGQVESQLISQYKELVVQAIMANSFTKEQFIKLKFQDGKSEQDIQDMIKDQLLRIIKMKVML